MGKDSLGQPPHRAHVVASWAAETHVIATIKNGHGLAFDALHEIRKLPLHGTELARYTRPEKNGFYERESDYCPSKTLHHPNREFWVMDGYGKDYIHPHNQDGTLLRSWGGSLGEGESWIPYGGALDLRDPANPFLVDRQFRVLANICGLSSFYENGTLQSMKSYSRTFIHPYAGAWKPRVISAWPNSPPRPLRASNSNVHSDDCPNLAPLLLI